MIDIHDVSEYNSEEKPRPQHCTRYKDLSGVNALLGPRVLPLDKVTGRPMPKCSDHDSWLECPGCGTVYAKYDVKQEAQLTSLVQPDADPFVIIERVRGEKKVRQVRHDATKEKNESRI